MNRDVTCWASARITTRGLAEPLTFCEAPSHAPPQLLCLVPFCITRYACAHTSHYTLTTTASSSSSLLLSAGEVEKKREERIVPARGRKLDYDVEKQSILLSLGPEAAAYLQEREAEAKAAAREADAPEGADGGQERREGRGEARGAAGRDLEAMAAAATTTAGERSVSTPVGCRWRAVGEVMLRRG